MALFIWNTCAGDVRPTKTWNEYSLKWLLYILNKTVSESDFNAYETSKILSLYIIQLAMKIKIFRILWLQEPNSTFKTVVTNGKNSLNRSWWTIGHGWKVIKRCHLLCQEIKYEFEKNLIRFSWFEYTLE